MDNKKLDNESSLIILEKLQILQKTLKQEIALREIFLNNKEELFEKIELNTYEYYKKKLSIQEIYFNNKDLNSTDQKYIKFELSKDSKSELPQCIDPLEKLFFYFRNNNEMLLKLINKIDNSKYEEFANFLCHFFYVDVFSSTSINEPLLVLIYLLIEKDINEMKDINHMEFLDPSKTFISVLLKSLTRRDDVKVYFETIINKLVFDLEELKSFYKEDTVSPFIGLEIYKLKDYLSSKYNLSKFKVIKEIEDYRKFLTSNIRKSNALSLFNKIKKEKSEKIQKNFQERIFFNYNNLFEKSIKDFIDEDIENKENENKNKERNKEENNNLKKISFYENIKNEAIDKILHGKTNKKKIIPKFRIRQYNEIEEYFLSSGYYTINNVIDNPVLKGISENLIDKDYSKSLNKEELYTKIFEAENKNMEEFYKNQIEIINKENNNDIFSNEALLMKLSQLKLNKTKLDKVIVLFKYNFEKIKNLIDKFLYVLIDNIPSIPYFIKCISVIIDRLLEIKFPNITKTKKNIFLGEFFFKNLLFPLLSVPNFNGIIMKISSINNTKKSKLSILLKILKQLYKGKLFNSNLSNESIYTIFNCYICEIMPSMFYFFDNLTTTEIPKVIEDLLEKKRLNVKVKNIDYEFFKYHENEGIDHQSICLTWNDYLNIYNILKEHSTEILGDSETIFYKTYKKLTFHDNTFKKKIQNDVMKNQKTFIFISRLNYTNNMKEKLSHKINKKFSFVGDDSENNENFQLSRIKYSINTIIKNLNDLTKVKFHYEKNENFIKGLNTLIALEGFSDVLKEKTIPLQWFGLYLESNIENIPKKFLENDFLLLFDLLMEECQKTLKEIQKDNTLNILFSKVVNTSKSIDIINYNLIRLKNNEKKFEILNFVRTANINIKLIILWNENFLSGIKFEIIDCQNQEKKEDKNEVSKIYECKNLNQIFELFPNFNLLDTNSILDLEKKCKIPESIMELISIVHKYIDQNKLFAHYSQIDLNDMKKEIENYIYQKLYEKIYPSISMGDDIEIYKNCFYLGWIKPEMIIKNYTSINENTINLCTEIISNMIFESCPRKKLNELQKLNEIINNMIILYGYNESNFDDILTYIAIKAQPTLLSTCYCYIDMFTPKKGRELKMQIHMNALQRLISKLKTFSYKDLINITEKEFNDNKKNKIIGNI